MYVYYLCYQILLIGAMLYCKKINRGPLKIQVYNIMSQAKYVRGELDYPDTLHILLYIYSCSILSQHIY
jgi:hypothetical protein